MKKARNLKRLVLDYVDSLPGSAQKPKEIFRGLDLSQADYKRLKHILQELADEGKITRERKKRFVSNKFVSTVTGIYSAAKFDFGFVFLEDTDEKIYIAAGNTGTAFQGDKVKVELSVYRRGKNREGKVVEVLERKRDKLVGTYHKSKNFGFVIPDDPKITKDIYISGRKKRETAKDGEKVVVEMESWGDEHLNPEGEISDILGISGEKGVEAKAVAISHGFNTSFPKEVVDECKKISRKIPEDEIKRRLDLRKKFIFTIDPDTAKDFDDAVSLERTKNGGWELGVHIADASYYVPEGSEIDKEAVRRCTSLYLADSVIPMLPPKLSDDLCSLMPDKDRLAFSIIMNLGKNGSLKDYTIAESVIHSRARLSYETAQEYIKSGVKDEFALKMADMYKLSTLLRKNRKKLGSIDFDLPEVHFKYDRKGFPISITPKERLDSHILIEEFMLFANQVAAGHKTKLENEKRQSLPYIFRIHDKPDEEKVEVLKNLLEALGYKTLPGKNMSPDNVCKILDDFDGTPESRLIETIVLRTMSKAAYDTNNIGHFGLAFKEYTHFTSPIRRYPDLILHRILKLYLQDSNNGAENYSVHKLKKQLNYISKTSTEREIAAAKAEREIIKIKQLEYMKRHLGDVFTGIITGVTSYGIFVELNETLAEGLIHIRDMDDDYYVYEAEHYRLTGSSGGKVYRLGDIVQAQLIKVDVENKFMDLKIFEE